MPLLIASGDPLAFYSTSAGVIPVIMLALAFQFGSAGFRFVPERILPPEPDPARRARRDAWISLYSLVVLAILLIGEAVALFVIAVGAPQPWWGALVGGALIVGAAGLVIPIVIAQVNAIAAGRETGHAIRNGALVAVKALIAVAALAGIAGGVYVVLAPSRVLVPDVVGAQSAFIAERTLQKAGLKLNPAMRQEVTSTAAAGSVLAQTPAAGTSVAKKTSVAIVVGVAALRSRVPSVVGETVDRAGAALRAAGLSLGSVSPASAPPDAQVKSQIPAAGEVVRSGTTVALFLGQ